MSLYPPSQTSVCSILFSYIPFTSSSLFKLSSLKLGLLLLVEFRSTEMRIQFSHFVSWRSRITIFLCLVAVQASFWNGSSPLLFQLNSHLSSLHSSSLPTSSFALLTAHKNPSRHLSNPKCMQTIPDTAYISFHSTYRPFHKQAYLT